jgi:2-oxo-4-hydroxy-4-carboxy--5-ureidoimidazoline (OHCU) decarboxylase
MASTLSPVRIERLPILNTIPHLLPAYTLELTPESSCSAKFAAISKIQVEEAARYEQLVFNYSAAVQLPVVLLFCSKEPV